MIYGANMWVRPPYFPSSFSHYTTTISYSILSETLDSIYFTDIKNIA